MRIFVFLLFLANLLFFAWTRGYFGVTENADAFRVSQQLRADQVRIVSNDVPPPEIARPEKRETDRLLAEQSSFWAGSYARIHSHGGLRNLTDIAQRTDD